MGECMSDPRPKESKVSSSTAKIEDVDTVKAKLKIARDRINNFMNLKARDIAVIDGKIS